MVRMVQENIDSFLYNGIAFNRLSFNSFFINPAITWIIRSFPFDIQLVSIYFNYFFHPKCLLIYFLQVFVLKFSNKFFNIKVSNNISPWNCIFNFFNCQKLLQTNWECIFYQKYFCILKFLHNHQL